MRVTMATVVLIALAWLPALADQGSVSELQAKKARTEAVLQELNRDSDSAAAESDRQQQNRPKMQSQYDPSQIDLSVQQATQALQIEINLHNLFVDYLSTCASRLSELPELSPYLDRLQAAARSLRDTTADVISNEQQQMSLQKQLQTAYHANNAREWNSLNSQYDAVQSREQQISSTMGADMGAAKAAIADAKSFLQNRIQALDADIAREAAADAERAKKAESPAASPPPGVMTPSVVTPSVMTDRAVRLVNMLAEVSKDLNLPKGPAKATNRPLSTDRCQDFFRDLGNRLGDAKMSSWSNDFPGKNADQIAVEIERQATSGGTWKKIEAGAQGNVWQNAQRLANSGVIVIGAQRSPVVLEQEHIPIKHSPGKPLSTNGHLAVVYPTPPDSKVTDTVSVNGPFVRDGNEHPAQDNGSSRIFPSTYGAVKASKAFTSPLDRTTNWYIWVPSNQ